MSSSEMNALAQSEFRETNTLHAIQVSTPICVCGGDHFKTPDHALNMTQWREFWIPDQVRSRWELSKLQDRIQEEGFIQSTTQRQDAIVFPS
jgi:hypothetical protein